MKTDISLSKLAKEGQKRPEGQKDNSPFLRRCIANFVINHFSQLFWEDYFKIFKYVIQLLIKYPDHENDGTGIPVSNIVVHQENS